MEDYIRAVGECGVFRNTSNIAMYNKPTNPLLVLL